MCETKKPSDEDIRTEYTSLLAYGRQVVGFRFTLLGFFLATAGLIVGGGNLSKGKFVLLGLLSIALWMLELRNRSLLIIIDDRAMMIERECWKYERDKAFLPFVCTQHAPVVNYTRIWKWKVQCPISHTKAFDFIYLIIYLYSMAAILGIL